MREKECERAREQESRAKEREVERATQHEEYESEKSERRKKETLNRDDGDARVVTEKNVGRGESKDREAELDGQ